MLSFKRISAALLLGGISAFADISTTQIHPDFTLETVKMPAMYKTMGLDFLPDGRMVLGVIELIQGQSIGDVPPADAGDKVIVFDGVGKTPEVITAKEVSNTWHQISGLKVVDGKIYVSDRDGLYVVKSLDKIDTLASNRSLVLKWPDEGHWRLGYMWHQWVFTPLYYQGRFYAPYSGCIGTGGWSYTEPTTKLSGAFLTWDLKDLKLEAVAGGLRSPNGANVDSTTGEFFVTDNQGSYLPASTFMRIKPGHFYGHRQIPEHLNDSGRVDQVDAPNFAESLPYDPPVAWIPYQSAPSHKSPSQPIMLREGRYRGDWLMGDVNGAGLLRVALDRVDSLINGSLFWFTQGMGLAAINRLTYGPDGSIYIGTLTQVAGNWPGGAKSPLFRLKPKTGGETTFDIRAIRSLKDGLEVELTDAMAPGSFGADSASAVQCQYIRMPQYGVGKQEDEPLSITKGEMSSDGKRLHLVIPGLKADRVVDVVLKGVKSTKGKTLWTNEGWFTLNAVSTRAWDAGPATAAAPSPRPAAFPASLRPLASGNLQVTLKEAGDFTLSLRGLDGALLDARSARGPGPVSLAPGRHGVFLVQIRNSSGAVFTRKAAL